MALFKEKLSEKILGNLELTCDEAVISFTKKQLTDTSRHHVVLEAILTATIPDGETAMLRLADQNFLESTESESILSPESPVIQRNRKYGFFSSDHRRWQRAGYCVRSSGTDQRVSASAAISAVLVASKVTPFW